MTPETLAPDLERRKRLRLTLRRDLTITPQFYEGSVFCVIKDPVSLRYYRFDEQDHFLLKFLDGTHTLEEARKAFERRFRPRQLSLEDLERFGQLLLKEGLAYHALPQAGQQLYDRSRKRRLQEGLRRFTNILYFEIPLCDPDPLLTRLLAWLGWLFTPWSVAASLGFLLAALLLVGTHFDTFWRQLPTFHEFFSFQNLLYLWVAVGVAKIVHELSHGLVCKAHGGEVHDMGFLFLCLLPCLYVNVTEAWRLPDKRARMLVGLAGVYAELLIAAGATFVWWGTPSHPFLHNLALSLVVVCSVNTLLFNGNPLLRYDGYYVLADWLEVPNLRERCNTFLRQTVMKHCLGTEVPPEQRPMALGRRVFFVSYAVLSYVYGWMVTFGVLWFTSRFLKPYKLGAVSMLMALFAVGSMVGWPLYYLGKAWHERGKLPTMKPERVALSATVLGLGILAFFLVPLPVSRVRQTGLVEVRPEAAEKVFVPFTGTLAVLRVCQGQRVAEGEILAEFRSLELDNQEEAARTEYAIRVAQLQGLRQQYARVKVSDKGPPAEERDRLELAISQADGECRVFGRQAALYARMRQRLLVRAPRAGVVFSPPRPDEAGKLWDKEQPIPLCSIGDPDRLRVLVPVSPADYRLLREDLAAGDLPVTVRVQGWGVRTWSGRLASLPESEAEDVPLALTTRAGGPLAVRAGSRPSTFVPQSQQYLVAVDLLDAEGAGIYPGTLAKVKVRCRWRTAAWWVWRTLSSIFDLGLI
jgi:putative peptide zinc metalloprotease protein